MDEGPSRTGLPRSGSPKGSGNRGDSGRDLELIRGIADGDESAFRMLCEIYLRPITSFVFRLLGQREEAEEVAQETFLRVFQTSRSFEPRAKPSTWIYTIAHNAAVDRLRQRRELAMTELVDEAPASERPSSYLEQKRTAEAVNRALFSLPERQRSAIALVHYQGLSNAEAAAVLEVGVDALESLLRRGRQKLRELLRELKESEGAA